MLCFQMFLNLEHLMHLSMWCPTTPPTGLVGSCGGFDKSISQLLLLGTYSFCQKPHTPPLQDEGVTGDLTCMHYNNFIVPQVEEHLKMQHEYSSSGLLCYHLWSDYTLKVSPLVLARNVGVVNLSRSRPIGYAHAHNIMSKPPVWGTNSSSIPQI